MSVFLPDNIFTRSLFAVFNSEDKEKVVFESSSMLAKNLNEKKDSIAFIPTLELITNQHFHISRSFGLSFDGLLCNSYIYFDSEQEQIGKIKIAGDISPMEVIMSKILFKELYNSDVELIISIDPEDVISGTHVIIGDGNFANSKFEGGLSFAEEVVQLNSVPYVNYVLASNEKNLLEEWTSRVLPKLEKIEFPGLNTGTNIDERSEKFIKENSSHIYLNFEQQDIVGINELIRMTYYHGIIKELFEVNFV